MEQSKFYQIKNVTEHEYTLVGCDGSAITRPIQDVDKSASAFTIQDAKDGDVLTTKDAVFIFKHMDVAGLSLCRSYCEVIGNSKLGLGFDFPIQTVHPATKEQRNFLFKKIKEEGYEWDAEKKELKKIEQKCLLLLKHQLE